MTQISLSDLKANTGKYVDMVSEQDVFITRNGKVVARLTAPNPDAKEAIRSLFGLIPNDVDLDREREERLGL